MSIQQDLAKFNWYHCIPVCPGVTTPGNNGLTDICRWALTFLKTYTFTGKTVLDVGARDCFYSLELERMGAAKVVAIDNDLSLGARDFLLPYLQSKVDLRQLSLYDLTAKDAYDAITFCGVLYHLRYPFRALRTLVDALNLGGILFIEGGFLSDPNLQHLELLHCPIETSPYDLSSCSFFNPMALDTTMRSMGCEKLEGMHWQTGARGVDRGVSVYRKARHQYYPYWEPGGSHTLHTRGAHQRNDWQPVETFSPGV